LVDQIIGSPIIGLPILKPFSFPPLFLENIFQEIGKKTIVSLLSLSFHFSIRL